MKPRAVLLQQGQFLIEGAFRQCDVRIVGSTIVDMDTELQPEKHEYVLPLNGLCIIPGLINSHDHLEFNLFTRLGHPPYNNYVEWSADIQKNYKAQILEVQKIPLKYRLLWGAYKNIFSGVTTVVHHNDYYWHFRFRFPLEVYKPYSWIHSLRLEKRDLEKLLKNGRATCFIHLAEGIDPLARGELKKLSGLGGLTSRSVIVHGVGLTDEDIETMRHVGCGMVWCPSSNIYLFGITAPIEKMIGRIPIALGSDSTLTGSLSLFDEMRVAQQAKQLSAASTLDLVTTSPAKMLSLNKGEIRIGAAADLLMFEGGSADPFDLSLKLLPSKIRWLWKNGRPIYGDVGLESRAMWGWKDFSKFDMLGQEKFVIGDFPEVTKRIKRYAPDLVPPKILPQ